VEWDFCPIVGVHFLKINMLYRLTRGLDDF